MEKILKSLLKHPDTYDTIKTVIEDIDLDYSFNNSYEKQKQTLDEAERFLNENKNYFECHQTFRSLKSKLNNRYTVFNKKYKTYTQYEKSAN